jgi:hypothetical protein
MIFSTAMAQMAADAFCFSSAEAVSSAVSNLESLSSD